MSLYRGLDEGTKGKNAEKEKMVLDLNLKWLKNNSHSAEHQYSRNLRLTCLLNIIRKTFPGVVSSNFDVNVNYHICCLNEKKKKCTFFFYQEIGNKMECKIIN